MEKIVIRKYTEKDVPAMCGIWNEVVEEGVAFPQEETLTEKTGSAFSPRRLTAQSPKKLKAKKSQGFTFCIRTTSAAAVILQTQATL